MKTLLICVAIYIRGLFIPEPEVWSLEKIETKLGSWKFQLPNGDPDGLTGNKCSIVTTNHYVSSVGNTMRKIDITWTDDAKLINSIWRGQEEDEATKESNRVVEASDNVYFIRKFNKHY